MPFNKILIANRGEIALRVMRSCRELGIENVAVHSLVDEDSAHVKLADESVCIGPNKPAQSYLNIPSILSAAEITNVDAIHPGYGFLSESSEFAECCEKWNVAFIGPSSRCIALMGDKITSKKIAKEAGVPVLETIDLTDLAEGDLVKQAEGLGYPVILKASAGGGGRGMKKIENQEQLLSSYQTLAEEAKAAFGDGTLFMEKYISRPRHIEIQIIADKHGNVIHLGERDCTVQRRFQKLIEEAPAPILSEATRKEIRSVAIALAKHIKYDSVGTVEFLYDMDSEKFYFMEMNTRIQVEHPVTEQLTNIDIIAEQIKIAAGEKLSIKQKDVEFSGHVIEIRVNAEDPDTGMPFAGTIDHYHRPGGMGIRVDDFIYTGYKIPPFYDSMISKIIVKAENREKCITRVLRALDETVITGIKTNLDLHRRIFQHPDFKGNNYATDFINRNLR